MSVMFLKNWVTRDYKCDSGMSVENVSVVVNIKTLKGQCIAHKLLGGRWVW